MSVPVMTFPTIGIGPTEWTLTSARMAEWVEAYPQLSVEAEVRKALVWINANPGRKKTAGGMPKFLVAWLNRAVDSGRGQRQGSSAIAMVGSTAFEWVCPHTPQHSGRNACHVQQQIDKAKAS